MPSPSITQTQHHRAKYRKFTGNKAGITESRHGTTVEQLQRSYGNRAIQRMVSSAMQDLSGHFSLAAGLKQPYREAANWLASHAKSDGMTNELIDFARLTSPQKQAVLKELGVNGDLTGDLVIGELNRKAEERGSIDWEQVKASIRSLQGVKLEDKETEEEKDIRESGAAVPPFRFESSGLVSVYQDIILWLNYKANKQGKTAFMQLFQSLSLLQKKAAIHKMARAGRLRFRAFTERMTKIVQYKRSVDWEAAQAALEQAKQMNEEQLSFVESSMQDAPIHKQRHHQDDDRLGSDANESLLISLIGIGASLFAGTAEPDVTPDQAKHGRRTGPDETDMERKRGLRSLSDDRSVAWLLTGVRGAKDGSLAVLQYMKSTSTAHQAVIDRYLNIANGLTNDKRDALREARMKQQGFHSVEQCLAHIMKELAAHIYNKGIVEKDPGYAKLVSDWGLSRTLGAAELQLRIAKLLQDVQDQS